jgi:hypothetical protein
MGIISVFVVGVLVVLGSVAYIMDEKRPSYSAYKAAMLALKPRVLLHGKNA